MPWLAFSLAGDTELGHVRTSAGPQRYAGVCGATMSDGDADDCQRGGGFDCACGARGAGNGDSRGTRRGVGTMDHVTLLCFERTLQRFAGIPT